MDDQATMTVATPEPMPRPLAVIEEQLRDLSEVLQAARDYGTPDAASRVGMTSLLKHERELLDEKHAAAAASLVSERMEQLVERVRQEEKVLA